MRTSLIFLSKLWGYHVFYYSWSELDDVHGSGSAGIFCRNRFQQCISDLVHSWPRSIQIVPTTQRCETSNWRFTIHPVFTEIGYFFVITAEWEHMWNQGSVEVLDDPTTAKLTYFSQYSIFSNLPALRPNQPPPDDQFFYGVARSGLAHGSRGQNHQVWFFL